MRIGSADVHVGICHQMPTWTSALQVAFAMNIKRIFNIRQTAKLLLLSLLLSMAACGSAPPRQPSSIEHAKKTDQAAHRALRDGDLMRARELFNQSMLLQLSLDNISAWATSAINLSSILHKLGDADAALGLLDDVLADKSGRIHLELRIAAAFRKAVILTNADKTADAEAAVQLAMLECNKKCAIAPGINNLHARLIFKNGDFSTALAIAKGVLNSAADKEEMANAQRIAADAQTALGQHDAALAHYQGALELDQELALSSRIAEDLKGIAKALEKLGRKQEAKVFSRRAQAVTTAASILAKNPTKK